MRHLKYYLFIVVLFLFYISQGVVCAENAKSSAIITVHNVGQGNCIDVAFSASGEEKDTEYMLIDIGSASYQKELNYTNQQTSIKAKELIQKTPVKEKKGGKIEDPSSIIKKSNFREVTDDREYTGEFKEANKPVSDFIKEMRDKFKDGKNKIKVKTVVITHPDTDHYKWLVGLFSKNEDHIENLILGGVPEHYDQSDTLKFKKWIQTRLKKGTKFYFPAIQKQPISKSLKDSEQQLTHMLMTPHTIFAEHSFSGLGISTDFEEAFNFGEPFKVILLSVNPTHFKGINDTILRMSFPEDDNSDSLVIKISNGKSSAILTGDATYLTTTRILDDYGKNLQSLQTNILLASHHGSATHGSNNEEWIQATQPEYVLISNGHFQGHPQSDAYEMFKKSDRLKFVSEHQVLVGKTDDFKEGSLHTTKRAVFSTLNSGTLTCNLMTNGIVELSTKTDGDIKELRNLRNNKEEVVDDVTLEEEGNKIMATPTRENEAKSRTTSTTTSAIPLSDSTLGEGEKTLSQGLSSEKKEVMVTTAKRKRNEQ